MKSSTRSTARARSKKRRKAAKHLWSANITQRYMELRRLRERLSEAESQQNAQ